MGKRVISRKYLIRKSNEKFKIGIILALSFVFLFVPMILTGDYPDGETLIALIICAIGGVIGFFREMKRRASLKHCYIKITKEVVVDGYRYTANGNTHQLSFASGRQVTINEIFYTEYEGTVVYLVQFPNVSTPWIFDCRFCRLDDELAEMCIDCTENAVNIIRDFQYEHMDEGAIL